MRLLLLLSPALYTGSGAMGGSARDARPRSQQTEVSSKDIIPGVVVVKLRQSNSVAKATIVQGDASSLLQAFAQCGVTSLTPAFPMTLPSSDAAVAAGRIDLSQMYFAQIPSTMDPVEVAARLAASPEVEYAEPKYYSYLCDVPNDSDYVAAQQVYFNRMKVAEGWTVQKGGAEVVIATVDGGTNWQHEDLAANLWINPAEDINHNGRFDPGPPPQGDGDGIDQDGNGKVDDVIGWNFATNANNPRGSLSTPGNADHGTETASEFGAVTNNGRGMAGTSWNCRLMPVCAADPKVDLSVPYGFEGIEYASRMGARVINCSWYRAGGWGNYSQWEQDVITAATQRGALIVAAAGNNHLQNLDDSPYYPASYDHVLSVGATTDTSDEIAYFTNMGLNVSVFAPGMRIHVAKDNGSYGTDQGTSHSSPLVAGLAGLLFAEHPDWTPDQVAEQIRMTSDPIDGENPTHAGSLGHGRVNFFRALTEVHSGIVVVAGRFHTPSERTLFVKGDTVILSVKVKNVLPLAAENLSFSVSADPVLAPFATIHGPTRLGPGVEDSLTCAFRVGDVLSMQDVKLRLEWSANSNEWDAHMFKTTLYAWIKDPRNPVLSGGAEGTWNRHVFMPYALYNEDSARYEMWFGASYGPSTPLWRPIRIGHAVSKDGISWAMDPSPVLTPDAGTWDASTTEEPMVIRENGQYKMWYTGSPSPDLNVTMIGYATSPDGIHWTKYSSNPVMGPGKASWEAKGPASCYVMASGNGYRMWYGAWEALPSRVGRIGYATSADGITWQRDTVNNPVVGVGTAGQWDAGMVLAPWVLKVGNTYYMWYTGGLNAECGGLAISNDTGKTWTKDPHNPVLRPSGGWERDQIEPGAVLQRGDTLDMWYAGAGGEASFRWSIGHATSRTPSVVQTVNDRAKGVPKEFMLAQNYPNPFNPSTAIRYELPRASQVTLTVYDLLGRQVSVLVNERRDAGIHEVKFDATGLASGVYFYRMQAGSYMETKKLLCIR